MDKNIDLHIHRKLSLLAGVWYPKPENYEGRSKCFRFLWKFYLYVPYAVMFVELVSQVIQIILSINNFEALTTCILSTVYVTQFLLKIAVLNKYDATFQRLFNELSLVSADLMSNPLGDQNFIKFHNEYYSVVKNIGVYKGSFQLASNICLNILFCIFSWVGMKRKVTAAFSWTPYDSSKNPGYTFTCLYEMICYGSVTARSGVVDLLFWVMIIIPMVQLNYLKYLLEIILKEKNELENGGHDDDDDDDGDVESYSSSCDEILTSQLKWWIKQHQRILR